MGKKLAIKGHSTRGNEVIELLEMMGGKISNECTYESGFDTDYFFFICEEEKKLIDGISYKYNEGLSNYICFTLEEFLEKYPFKVGDKVYTKSNAEGTIIDIFWDGIEVLYQLSSANVNALGYFHRNELKSYKEEVNMKDNEGKLFDSIIWHLRNSINNGKQNLSGGECEEYFREVVKKNNENKMKNVLAELLEHIKTTPKEDLEREFEEIAEWSNVGPTVEEFRTFCECVNKKPVYLDNYDECVRIAKNIHGYDIHIDAPAYRELLESFVKLLICRDAYWKIYGEYMGLGKPWEPDWMDETTKYGIRTYQNTVIKDNVIRTNCAFVFPTPEIQDAFYENFKDLIEQCKELL